MGKILFFIFAAIVGWLLFKGLVAKSKGGNSAGAKHEQISEKMLKCDRCGVFIPASESMSVDGKLTCRIPERCLQRQSA